MLMSLGEFVFELSTLAFNQLQRQNDWRHASAEPVGAAPEYQPLGPGAETFQMSGTLYREFGNREGLDTLREMADTGEAFAMVDGTGKVYGMYVINTISETGSYLDLDGVPKKIEFSMRITRVKPPADDTQAADNESSENTEAESASE